MNFNPDEVNEDDDNDLSLLVRYEFMELVVRVAGKKYNVKKSAN